MSGQLFVNPTKLPSWILEQDKKVNVHQFDNLIKSSGKHITESIFRKEFLPFFIATNEIPESAYDSFIKRWIFYAHQAYNELEVYRTVDANGIGTDLLFIVPPLWNPKAPVLKTAATKPPADENGKTYEKDPTIFRTLVARINQYIVAQDQFQLAKYRDHFLPSMVEDKAAIEIDDLLKWRTIFQFYKIENESSKIIDRLLAGQTPESQAQIEERQSGDTMVTGVDEL